MTESPACQQAGDPLVSVIIPTYRRAHLVGGAIDAALAQTHRDVEVIVVDDASGDDTGRVVGAYTDPRVRYLCHPDNLGGNAARATGVAHSHGPYLAFVDSDDSWHPDKLRRQLLRLRAAGPGTALCYTWHQRLSPDGALHPAAEPRVTGRARPELLIENVIGTFSSVLVQRAAYDAVGGLDPRLPSCQDWEFYLRLNAVYAVCVEPAALVTYRDDPRDPVRISVDRGGVARGHRFVFDRTRSRIAALDPADARRAYATYLRIFAEVGALTDLAAVATAIPTRTLDSALAADVAHLAVRALRRRAATRTAQRR